MQQGWSRRQQIVHCANSVDVGVDSGLDNAALANRIVGDHEAAGPQPLECKPGVVRVVRLVGIDERDVVRAGQCRQHIHAIAAMNDDAVAESRALEPMLGGIGMQRCDLDRVQSPTSRQLARLQIPR